MQKIELHILTFDWMADNFTMINNQSVVIYIDRFSSWKSGHYPNLIYSKYISDSFYEKKFNFQYIGHTAICCRQKITMTGGFVISNCGGICYIISICGGIYYIYFLVVEVYAIYFINPEQNLIWLIVSSYSLLVDCSNTHHRCFTLWDLRHKNMKWENSKNDLSYYFD